MDVYCLQHILYMTLKLTLMSGTYTVHHIIFKPTLMSGTYAIHDIQAYFNVRDVHRT